MKIYSAQILMAVAFLGELILWKRPLWIIFSGGLFALISFYNAIMEIREGLNE